MQLTPITPTIGVEVAGVDLGSDLDDETIAALRRAFLDHHVVVFRD